MLRRGLEASKNAKVMVENLLKFEADKREQCKAYEQQVSKALEEKRPVLEEKTNAELKQLCASRGLKLGVGKQERVETLLEDARSNGEVDQILSLAAKERRRTELLALESSAVLEVCDKLDVDPMVKEVAIERLLLHEDEHGPIDAEEKPQKKRPRKTR